MKKVTIIMLLLLFIGTLLSQTVFDNAIVVRQGTNIEWFRSSTTIEEGVVFVWSDTRDGGRDLFAQLISSSGEKLWGENGIVVDNNADRQEDPMVITTTDNGVIIAYVCFADDADGNVKAQKINAAGEKLWGQYGIDVCSATNVQISLNMVPDSNGGAYIAWSDYRGSFAQIYAQHLNSSGVASWQNNGISIDTSAFNKGSNTFWEDEEGGAVMAYVRYPEQGNGDIFLVRMTVEDQILWGPTPLIQMPGNQGNTKMAPDGVGGFIFAWESVEPVVQLKLQRIDINGNLLWDENGISLFPTNNAQERHRIVEVSSGGAIIAWEDKRTHPNTNPDLYVQKIDLNGNQLWQEGGIPIFLSGTKQENLRMSKTNDGGTVIVWEDARYTSEDEKQVFAQKFNADGSLAWGEGGMLISDTMGGQTGANVKVYEDLYSIVWADERTGSLALMTQMINESGEHLLQSNGIEVYYGLSGNADIFKSFSHNDITYILWLDTRHGTFGDKMYYQIINAQGNAVMPHNGARVSLDDVGYIAEDNLSANINSNGELCIAWTRNENTLLVPYVQIINPSGERLLGDYGIKLRDNASARPTPIVINWRNNAWEIFWTENVDMVFSIVGQRIVNGQRVWGNNGKVVLRVYNEFEMPPGINTPVDIAFSDYLIFTFENLNPQDYSRYINYKMIKITDDGDIAPGWGPMGKPIYLNYQNQSNASAFIHDEKIIVLWEEIVDEELDFCIHAAIFDLNGEPIGENYKYNLTPFEYVQREYDAFINDSYLYLTFRDFSNYTFNFNKIITQKYSLTNNSISPVWDGVGKPVVIDDYHHSKPSTVPMYSRVLVAWEKSLSVPTDPERDSDIYMNMLDPVSGNILGQPTGFVVNNHNKDQIDPIVTKNNNTLVSVVWRDGLSSGKEPIHGLYMQRVNTGTFTPANDLAVDTPAPFKSLGNYPNPFNPETKIAFNMNFTAEVKIDVFNIKGQKIKSLVNELMEKGNHTVLWNGTNDQNNPVSSGLYFYKISTKDHSSTHKMLLLK